VNEKSAVGVDEVDRQEDTHKVFPNVGRIEKCSVSPSEENDRKASLKQ